MCACANPSRTSIDFSKLRSVTYYQPHADHHTFWFNLNLSLFDKDVWEIKRQGVNCIWIEIGWGEFVPNAYPIEYSEENFQKLEHILLKTKEAGLFVLMVMGYVDNIPEGITGTNYFAPTYLTNETEFQVYINFIKEVTKRTRKFDNIAYVFCTEIFDISLKYGLSYPTNIESFRNYCRTKNPDLNYWNGRWKTNPSR